jgi:glycosidase
MSFLRLLLIVSMFCSGAAAQMSAPVISKVDPPNWWAGMPNPMLLVHGSGFDHATFSVTGKDVAITRQQVSANGHWAFLWLDSAHAAAQPLSISVHGGAGDASHPFALESRRPPSSGFAGFSPADVLYLIMPDRFADGDRSNDPPQSEPGTYDRSIARAYHGGDLKGIEQHLDYLQQLGVTAIWVTPVYDNSANHNGNTYHGYSATDMYAVDPHLGRLADFQHLADTVHARGMKLVLDTVPNHVGPKHPWVIDEPTPDWFHGTAAQHIKASGNFSPVVDPHGAERDLIPPLHGWFADVLPDLNQENPLVSTYLIQNAEWWIESAGIDGLRIDTFPYVSRAFWHDFHAQLHTLYPRLTTVGEVFDGDPTIVSYFAGGNSHAGIDTGLDTPFDFPVYFALRNTLVKGESMTELARVLRQDSLYPHPERLVPFEGNHDTKRFLSEQNATPDELKLAFGLLATVRGMPEIYSGDEIAMEGGDDPDNRRDFPGGFPGDAHNAFTPQARTAAQNAVHDWVRDLLLLRRAHPALQGGKQQDIFVDDTAFAFVRTHDLERGCSNHSPDDDELPLLVVLNNSDKARNLVIHVEDTALRDCSKARALFNTHDAEVKEGNLSIALEPRQIAVYQVR